MTTTNSPTNAATIWTLPFLSIIAAHFVMDAFSGMIPSSLGVLQDRWNLTDQQGAWLLGVGSLCSGLAQPLFAWISDRTGSRVFGGLGLAIVGILLSNLGLAAGPVYLFAFYCCGMVGNGMFHPIAASTMGQLNPVRRSLAVSCFFVAGMLGQITGTALGPRLLVLEHGFDWLRLTVIPALLVALLLHRNIRDIEHRVIQTDSAGDRIVQPSNWPAVGLLYLSAATRFLVTLALVYLYVRWTESLVAVENPEFSTRQISQQAAPLAGNLNAASIAGMAIGGFASGALIPAGREKWPYVVLPLICAPLVMVLPYCELVVAGCLAFGAGLGLAALVPVTITLAQRLMPGRTSLASGLMMGGAWAFAMFGPVLAEFLIETTGLKNAFAVVAALMAISGFFILPVKSSTISESVDRIGNHA